VILYGGFPQTSRMKQELKKYTRPSLLVLDELGFLPIDKAGAGLLFQVISQRYEQGAMVITSNKAFNDWPEIFNNDSTLTSAILIDSRTTLKLLNSRE
jgi:DNA replication protein DnaC